MMLKSLLLLVLPTAGCDPIRTLPRLAFHYRSVFLFRLPILLLLVHATRIKAEK